jgi:putative membrane protein
MSNNAVHLDKRIIYGIYVFTAVVYALVILLHELPEASFRPGFIDYLPALNATINGTCFLLLVASLVAIKTRMIPLHKLLNTTAMVLSVVFLLSYVLNHYFSGDTVYGGDMKGLYYFVLISHILLAAISLPFILMAYYKAFAGDIQGHRKLVKFTYPMWVYVTFTGVLVYLFLAPYYGS